MGYKAKVDPPPDDTPEPVESVVEAKSDDAWEDVIAVDERKKGQQKIKEDESSDDTPDWGAEETWTPAKFQ